MPLSLHHNNSHINSTNLEKAKKTHYRVDEWNERESKSEVYFYPTLKAAKGHVKGMTEIPCEEAKSIFGRKPYTTIQPFVSSSADMDGWDAQQGEPGELLYFID